MHLLERQSGCLDFTLAVVFLKVKIVVAVLQNTGTTAAETAEGRVAVSGYQISSTASMKHCRSSPANHVAGFVFWNFEVYIVIDGVLCCPKI